MDQNEIENSQTESASYMEGDITQAARDEGFWREMWHQVRLVWSLLRDPDVPLYLKILPFAALIYILVPTDLIPDFIPVVGQLDDLTALIVGGKVFVELSPQRVVAQHIEAMRARGQQHSQEDLPPDASIDDIIIEGEFEEVDSNDDQG